MNVNISEREKKHFSIEDVVSYSNIEITHANDNAPPAKIIAVKIIIWGVIATLAAALFFIR
jgi:hypothetical protein